MRKNAGKSLTPGPKAVGGGVEVVEMYASAVLPKEGTLMKLVVVKTARMKVVAMATKWMTWLIKSNLFSIIKSMVGSLKGYSRQFVAN